ncbi:MAG: 3-methyl-2-oxobutanoate hydroxymethyltransferase [Trichodesmium sp. St16_bin4-tuft]|nr:3-methyl-2-oxobutanoate hydroxymethyltransferase [Trichodesmium sp. St4_bin8_1]MDE5073951.1 3-methyl-2-oxobutanoate hydroxymethyltransferase [Trichodesmium sp. St5_bin8]MDE5077750.1 3-methyl-2-oxobutanoate hydroxymethyltransferase [Trichodesmium sp. St2_bin6]MDE5090430.1 3-methyl-2-oxobutanoate hydroxymethyltransferase [Trichodesmium sp. St18_bin3_1_1]MDE5098153.1 3-methyl-2-oxobutanoate hydroxymethyltransferase [Trichodesmium sp. St16_bin4-tuft]MDE5104018.1 3-methyl-2-oxobutanoate hydroxym
MAVTTKQLIQWKQKGRPIVALTAYDYTIAQLLDNAGVDLILVGDSLGMVTLGYETTLPVTLEEMIHHAKAVRRAVKQALMVVDLPFLTYQESPQQAIHSAGRILKETGAQAVKLESGNEAIAQTVKKLTSIGIPVMGHIGLIPQSVHQFGGYPQQGNTPDASARILTEALALAEAGAFALILEHIKADLAKEITGKVSIPTIGIGAGAYCDGQILVINDVLGLSHWQPPFAKPYVNLRETITQAVQEYSLEVKKRKFPQPPSP